MSFGLIQHIYICAESVGDLMQITGFWLTAFQIGGNAEGEGFLIGQRPYYEYVDGKKTGNQLGITYDAVFQDNQFEKAAVKVASTQAIVTDEQLKGVAVS